MKTITLQKINNRLAILYKDQPCLWVVGGAEAWRSYIEAKESQEFTVVWRA
jgi:hypothetical protein